MDNKIFAEKITQLRNSRGLSQKQLGEMLDVSNKAVSKWENGESLPKTSTMLKLAEIFEIDVNELIGLASGTPQEDKSSEEINRLKSENALLSSKLNKMDKRKKLGIIAVTAFCVIGIIISAVVAYFTAADKSINSQIKDAGVGNTSITFSEKTFVPAPELDAYIAKNQNYFNVSKNAVYTDAQGQTHNIIIDCDRYSNFIRLQVGGKDYYYTFSVIERVTVENVNTLMFYYDSIFNEDYDYDYDSDYFYNDGIDADDAKAVKVFCDYYKNKGKPVEKNITQNFLGNKARTVEVELQYGDFNNYDSNYDRYKNIKLGEFYKDNKGNVYFYDYVTTNSYSVGKELSNYVYEN